MVKYTCELCLKKFRQKIDYDRHKNKKNACVNIKQLRKIEQKKSYKDSSEQQLTTLFSSCMDILRDSEHLTGDKALRNLSYLLVLKLIEPMNGKEINFDNHDYNLGEWESKRTKLIEYTRFSKIASSEEENIPRMLEIVWDLILSQYPKTKDIFLSGKGFDIKKQKTFTKLVKKLNEFDFSDISVDIQGHAYEDLLKEIMTGQVLGQYFTQPLVKDLMVEVINPRLHDDGTCETIFDPAMGTGGFLMTSLAHMKKQAEIERIEIDWDFMTTKGLGGRECEPDTFQMTKANMLISSGHMLTGLEQGDSIRDPITNKYDIVLANPPFGIKGLEYQEIDSHLRDSYIPIESKSAVPLFLQAIISMLKIGGRCAMVMPDGQELFGKRLVALREYLMKTCDLKEIYFMPSGVFTNTSIKTCVIYFQKKKEGCDVVKIGGKKTRTYKFSKTHQTKKVKFYDYNPYEKVKNLLVEVEMDRLAENNYSLNYAEYLEEEEEEEEKMGGEVEWKTLGEVCERVKRKVKIQDDEIYSRVTISSTGTGCRVRDTLLGEQIGTKSQFSVDRNDFLLSKIDFQNGAYGFSTDELHGCIVTNDFWTLQVKNIDRMYFKYYMDSGILQETIKRKETGCTGRRRLKETDFYSLKIPVPPLHTQQQIVEKLDFLYEKSIKTSEQRIEELKKERGMWVETLTLGEEEKTLGDVCEVEYGTRIVKKNNIEGEYPVYGSGRDMFTTQTYNREGFNILIGRFALSKECVRLVNHKLFLNDSGLTVKPKGQDLIHRFLGYYLFTNQDTIYKCSRGVAQRNMDMDHFKDIKIPVPPLATQKEIVKRCEQIDALIAELEQTAERNKELAKLVLDKNIQNCSQHIEKDEDEDEDVIIESESESDEDVIRRGFFNTRDT